MKLLDPTRWKSLYLFSDPSQQKTSYAFELIIKNSAFFFIYTKEQK